MCPWVGSHAPSSGRQLWGLPSRMGYLSPQGVLLPRVYGTTASPLCLELRGPAAWQATPSWAVCRHACHQLLPWLQVTFAMVPDAAWPGWDQWPWSTSPATGPVRWLGCPSASDLWGVDRCVLSLRCPRCLCVLPLATWCLFTVVRAVCGLHVLLVVASFLPPPKFSSFFFALYLFCFVLLFCFFPFFEKKKGGASTLQAQAWAPGAAVP